MTPTQGRTIRSRVRTAFIISTLMAATIGIPISPAHAAVLNVTKTADTFDGACDADCSLREAVGASNGSSGPHTIFVPSGEYTLTGAGLDIASTVTIEAVDGEAIVIGTANDRVFDVQDSGNATLKELLVTGGKAGGIFNTGTLNLVDTTVSGNAAEPNEGGGGISSSGVARLTNSSVTGNTASYGGGIANQGELHLTNVVVVDNQATYSGGGISNAFGTARVANSTINSNSVSQGGVGYGGGGIANGEEGELDLTGSYLIDNRTAGIGSGGGVWNDSGDTRIVRTQLAFNNAGSGGGIYTSAGTTDIEESDVFANTASFGGGVSNAEGTTTVRRSIVNENSAGTGGGIHNDAGPVRVVNSTVSDNEARVGGGGISTFSDEPLRVSSSTIVGNASDTDDTGGDGGGIHAAGGAAGAGVMMSNTILAGNQDGGTPVHPDCSGRLVSKGHNIIGSTTGCDTDLQGSDSTDVPTLEQLNFNGGWTRTYALPAKSIAVDHGPRGSTCPDTDQRGAPRSGRCDTGAYERAFCGSVLVNIVGTSKDDEIVGSDRVNGILGLGGDDVVRASGGADRLCGGRGDDRLSGDKGNDQLFGAQGDDRLDGGPGRDSCVGGPGKNKLTSC